MHAKALLCLFAAVLTLQASTTIDQNALKDYLETGAPRNLIIIDIRAPGEIESAIGSSECRPYNLPWPAQFIEQVDRIPKDADIVIYCFSGGRSSRAVDYLRTNGFGSVHDAGGIMTWKGPTVPPSEMKQISVFPQPSCERALSACRDRRNELQQHLGN